MAVGSPGHHRVFAHEPGQVAVGCVTDLGIRDSLGAAVAASGQRVRDGRFPWRP